MERGHSGADREPHSALQSKGSLVADLRFHLREVERCTTKARASEGKSRAEISGAENTETVGKSVEKMSIKLTNPVATPRKEDRNY